MVPLNAKDGKLRKLSRSEATLSEARFAEDLGSDSPIYSPPRYNPEFNTVSPSKSSSQAPRAPSDGRRAKAALTYEEQQEEQLQKVQQLRLDLTMAKQDVQDLEEADLRLDALKPSTPQSFDKLKLAQIRHSLLDAQYAKQYKILFDNATPQDRHFIDSHIQHGFPRSRPAVTASRQGRLSLPVPPLPLPGAGHPGLWKQPAKHLLDS